MDLVATALASTCAVEEGLESNPLDLVVRRNVECTAERVKRMVEKVRPEEQCVRLMVEKAGRV